MKQIDMAQMPRKELEKFAMEASGEAERLRAVVEAKEAELRLLRKEKFAGKSEKSRNDNVDEAQLSFFNDAEALARPDAEEPKLEKVKPPRKPKKKGRKKEKLEKLPGFVGGGYTMIVVFLGSIRLPANNQIKTFCFLIFFLSKSEINKRIVAVVH